MNVWIQVLIGSLIGLIFAFLTMSSAINSKEKELKTVWRALSETLNDRYTALRKILALMGEYMENSKNEIEDLSILISDSIDEMTDLEHFAKRLENENKINDKLENIKVQMENYPELINDVRYNELAKEIMEKEGMVGEAIRIYNAYVLEFKVLLETFPYSFVGWVLNKTADNYGGFNVMQIEEFNENYIDDSEV